MKILGFRIITESEYQEYRKAYVCWSSVTQCYRWFSGWKDLDIIWDYVLSSTYYGGISSARKKYAEARGTNEYGQSVELGSKL